RHALLLDGTHHLVGRLTSNLLDLLGRIRAGGLLLPFLADGLHLGRRRDESPQLRVADIGGGGRRALGRGRWGLRRGRLRLRRLLRDGRSGKTENDCAGGGGGEGARDETHYRLPPGNAGYGEVDTSQADWFRLP